MDINSHFHLNLKVHPRQVPTEPSFEPPTNRAARGSFRRRYGNGTTRMRPCIPSQLHKGPNQCCPGRRGGHVLLQIPRHSSTISGDSELYKPSFAGCVDVDLSQNKKISLILIDHSIMESFGEGGKTVITSRVYPTRAIQGYLPFLSYF